MRTLALSLLAFAALAACETTQTVAADGPRKVATKSGVIVGETANGVSVFKGVPYAKPPVGALRWAPPQPVSWSGERAATAYELPCLQPTSASGAPNGAGVTGASKEDCLYLNVWAPANARKAPIMLWLYGGGGTMGGGHIPTYAGDNFARDGVVLVTINYRLGALAGFSHPAITKANGSNDANFHLLDAMAALKWMKDNAAAFGGDADNITVFGESAGATMVANLLTSPQAKGLFNRAIIESTGSLPTPGTPLARAQELGAAFATAHGLPGKDATIDQLRAIPADAIMANAATRGGLRTVIDGTTKTQSIMDAFTAGNEIEVPFIIGTNSDEGRLSGTQRVATFAQDGKPVFQYFFDYVQVNARAANPNGAPHAHEIPFAFDTLGRRGGEVAASDQKVADLMHSCWVAFVKQPLDQTTIRCKGFDWPARTEANGRTVAHLKETPALMKAADVKSPPNGAPPGRTSRDED